MHQLLTAVIFADLMESTLMDMVLKIITEVICAAAVIYILFRETSGTLARKLEARTAKLFDLVRRTDGRLPSQAGPHDQADSGF